MKCFDCGAETKLDLLDQTAVRDEFEVIFKCLECNATFFATVYRDLNQSTEIVDCKNCKEEGR